MKNTFILISLMTGIIILIPALSSGQKGNSSKTNRSYMHQEIKDGYYVHDLRDSQGRSPAYKFESSLFFTTQVNIDEFGNNILGDAANEPSIAIDPTNPNRMMIGWRQFNTVSNSFRQAGYAYTSDGGQNWTFPGVIEPGVFRSDPVLECNSEGVFYYNSLTSDGAGGYWCNVYRSGPGNFNWDNGVFAQGGDKQWMTIDRSGGMGNGNIYAFWTSYYSICAPGSFTRSVDGGNSYENCVTVDEEPYWGTLAVGPSGELYVAGSGWDGIVVAKSINAQNPANVVSWDSYSMVDIDGYLTGWEPINPAGLMGQAYIAVDNSGGPGHGNVYVLASVSRNSIFDPGDVMFARSTDGGNSWSAPLRINDDLNWNDYQWFGTMSVAPNGRIDVAWLDTRDDPSGNFLSALYYSYSMDQGFTWSANEKLSEIFDPHIGWPQQQKMGDYFDMKSDEGSAHLAWCNTINGEQDVYYTRITPQITGIQESFAKTNFISFTVYPNPFNDQANIRYVLPVDGNVELILFDVFGKVIKTLVNGWETRGIHNVILSSDNLTKGIYYCRLVTGDYTKTICLTYVN